MCQNWSIEFIINSGMFLNDLNIRMDVRLKKVNIIYLRIVSIIEI